MSEIHFDSAYGERVSQRVSALQAKFDLAFSIVSPEQRKGVESLLARIGTIDWETEGYESPDNQRDLSIKFHWGHDHRFSDDLSVKGRMGPRHIQLLAEFIEGFNISDDHFAKRSVLDIGCWTGGTTLSLKMMGAADICAIEEVRKYSDAAQELTSGVYGLRDVTFKAVSLYSLDEGTFDHVYVPGVVYHLSDPVLGLRRLFNRLRDGGDILVESMGYKSDKPLCQFYGNRIFHTSLSADSLDRGGWNWFVPSASCLELWMQEAGFEDIRVFHSPYSDRVFGHGWRRGYRPITLAGLAVRDA